MALSIRISQVGSTNATPTQYTVQSPSLDRYRMTSTIIDYGDQTTAANAAGIVGNGFVKIQYHENNRWVSETIFTSQTGAQLNTLVVA